MRNVKMSDTRFCWHWDGKPEPTNFGSNVVCGFRKGRFKTPNWNCYLMNELREASIDNAVWNEDQNLATFTYPTWLLSSPHVAKERKEIYKRTYFKDLPEFGILSYYKSRGETMRFWVVNSAWEVREGTESDARLFVVLKKLELVFNEKMKNVRA